MIPQPCIVRAATRDAGANHAHRRRRLEVVKASLSGIVQEMQNSLFRTGFSTIMREVAGRLLRADERQGEVVAQHVVLPLHIGAFPACCAAVLRTFDDDIDRGRRLPHQPPL